MTEIPVLIVLSAGAGLALGLSFLAALGWTVARLATSPHPVRLVLASMILRFSGLLAGLYAIALTGGWVHLLAAVAGFSLARAALFRLGPARLGSGTGR